MKFWKMNGAGNDFLLFDLREMNLKEEQLAKTVRVLCERHQSVGADGVIFVDAPSVPGADLRMLFYNSDGTKGEMCGNGARCICRYAYERGFSGSRQVIETESGLVTGERLSERQYRVRLTDPSVIELNRSVQVKLPISRGREEKTDISCAYVELGEPGLPHAVVEIPLLKNYPEENLRCLGRALCHAKAFPKGANVNFYSPADGGSFTVKTFERGVEDFTYACGTGTGSLALVLTLEGRVSGKDVLIHNPGGDLSVDVIRSADGKVTDLFLTGPTNIVAKGDIFDENLAKG